jgi:hypothetical protein
MLLRSGRGGNPLNLAPGGEWTDQAYNDSGTNLGITIADNGGFAAVGTLTPTPYRCGFDLVRPIGAYQRAIQSAPARNSDGS